MVRKLMAFRAFVINPVALRAFLHLHTYSAPRACTKDKNAIAQCDETGGLCILRFEASDAENNEF